VPSGFSSLDGLAGGQGVLVLLASTDTILGERWRSTLTAFHGQADFGKLGAGVAAVSRVPTNAYRKLSRKAGVGYPLLSDPQSLWLGPLRCEAGSVVAFVLEPGAARIISSFRGSEPLELLRRVQAKVQEYKEGGVAAAAAPEAEAAAAAEEEEAAELSDAAALDEMSAMWAEAEADSLAAAEAAWGLGAEEAAAEAEAAALQARGTQQRPRHAATRPAPRPGSLGTSPDPSLALTPAPRAPAPRAPAPHPSP